jgi:hypothetical protein
LLINALNSDKKIIGRKSGVNNGLNLVCAAQYLVKTKFNQILYYEWNGNIIGRMGLGVILIQEFII